MAITFAQQQERMQDPAWVAAVEKVWKDYAAYNGYVPEETPVEMRSYALYQKPWWIHRVNVELGQACTKHKACRP